MYIKCTRALFMTFTRIVLVIMVGVSSVIADDVKKMKSKGMVATGFNRLLNKPLMMLGGAGDFGYSTLGAYNDSGDMPHKLSKDTKKSALLVTYVDKVFLESFQGEQPYILDPTTLNVPLRDVPANVDITGSNFQIIPPVTEIEPYKLFKPGQAFPFKPIKLKQWLEAKGEALVKCETGKDPVVKLKMKGLVPNRFYSVWAFFDKKSVQFPMKGFGPVRPLGGTPNMVVSDHAGNATFERELNFCPMDLKDDEVPLSNIFIMFHSNHHFAGTVPTFPELGRFPGNVRHIHLHFPFAAKRIEK